MKKIFTVITSFVLHVYSIFYFSLFFSDYSFLFKKPFSNIAGFTGIFLFLLLARFLLDRATFANIFLARCLRAVSRWDDKALLAVIFGYLALSLSLMGIFRHLSLCSMAWDMGIYEQALWNTLRGDMLFSSIKGNMNLLGDHFQPILFILVPFYAFFAHPATLIVIQAFLLAGAIIPLYLIARWKLTNRPLVFSLLVSYALGKGVRGVGLSDFHPESFMPLLSAGAFYFLIRGRNFWFAVMVALLLGCKETAVFITAGIGVYAFLALKRRQLGLLLILLSAFCWVAETRMIIPFFNSEKIYPYYARLPFGEGYAQNIGFLLRQPFSFLKFLFLPGKVEFFLKLAGGAGFFPLFALPELVMVIFSSLTIILGNKALSGYYLLSSHYVGQILGLVYICGIYGAGRLFKIINSRAAAFGWDAKRINSILFLYLIAMTLFFNGKTDAYKLHKFILGYKAINLRQKLTYLSLIPRDASVAATANLVPHISHRRYIYALNNENEPNFSLATEYIVMDFSFGRPPKKGLSNLFAELSRRGYEKKFCNPQESFFIFFHPSADRKQLERFRGNLLL